MPNVCYHLLAIKACVHAACGTQVQYSIRWSCTGDGPVFSAGIMGRLELGIHEEAIAHVEVVMSNGDPWLVLTLVHIPRQHLPPMRRWHFRDGSWILNSLNSLLSTGG